MYDHETSTTDAEREPDDASTSTEVEGIVKKVKDLQVDEANIGTLDEQGRGSAVGRESDEGLSSGGEKVEDVAGQVPGEQLAADTAGSSTGQDAFDGSSFLPAAANQEEEENMRMLDPEEGAYYLSDIIINAFNRYIHVRT